MYAQIECVLSVHICTIVSTVYKLDSQHSRRWLVARDAACKPAILGWID